MVVNITWPWNILWSDEANFCLNEHVITHKCRIWAVENPHAIQEQPLHPDKDTVWCGFTAIFIIGPYSFEEITANGIQTCSVTGQRYRDMLKDFVIPQLQQRECLQDIIFMQDGATPHIDRRVKQLLRQHFTDARVISRHFPTAWLPHSPDIIPCVFWLWGFLKDSIYRERQTSLPDLKDSIPRHVLDIPADSPRSAVENMVSAIKAHC
ncbi:hypothetical protein AVEN_80951-1 [Araneus ventricosus]|uniref:Tc1-like transposase DDE domain-containing protein n=1 Tax=Araneus ventricosus TaxID=182803 RepID=A0A4Y2TW72_ARAVE|nr:hypothetical protein AVEN_80951-1 [Araneus ventricosus]